MRTGLIPLPSPRPTDACLYRVVVMILAVICTCNFHVLAQTPANSTPAQDPLMSLLLSQPRIEIANSFAVTAEFDPPVIRPAEQGYYRISINALQDSVLLPEKLPAPSQLELRSGARGQTFQVAGQVLEPRSSFLFHVRATRPGEFTIPSFPITVYGKTFKIPATKLSVSADLPENASPRDDLSLEVPATNLYVGQAIRVGVVLPSSSVGVVQSLAQVQVTGNGFITDASVVHQRIEPRKRGSNNVMAFIYETVITPIASGTLTATAQAFAVGTRIQTVMSGTNVFQNAIPLYKLIDSNPVRFQVLPLPREGQLPGFTGAVGMFGIETPVLSTNVVRAGDPLKLRLVLRGTGNLPRLVPPPPPKAKNWQVLPAVNESGQPTAVFSQGFASFIYTLIPLTDQTSATPAIPFSYFDPTSGRYTDLSVPPLTVTVLPGPAGAELEAVMRANAISEGHTKDPEMNGLVNARGVTAATLVPLQERAWFPLLQLLPAVGFAALWGWDRRRRYYQKHPYLVLRRRARRELRRQRRLLRRAARNGKRPEFAAIAVTAMRVACAPHYPAEVRALVGKDIIDQLPGPARSGHTAQLVRRFFDATDASLYGIDAMPGPDLLQHHPELEQVLDQLEARL